MQKFGHTANKCKLTKEDKVEKTQLAVNIVISPITQSHKKKFFGDQTMFTIYFWGL